MERVLQGKIAPIRPPWLYRAGLLATAVALVLLQAAYVALVAAAIVATGYYIALIPVLQGITTSLYLKLLIIAGPVIVGAVVTFFLMKPLLSRRAAPAEGLELRPDDAPILFAFVERVCACIGAPTPSRIEIDLQVNASAGLRRGWRSFFSQDLTLTIGLPLAGGLTVREFAGILAHEFGHFTQAAGMRVHFTIESVRFWFARVAYERDAWDVRLDTWREGGDWRLRVVFHLAHAAVTASRWILRGLLHSATAISAWFSRQMEFDADRHQAALVGGATLAQAGHRISVLTAASSQAWEGIERAWQSRQLTEDIGALIHLRESLLDQDTRRAILQNQFTETTGRWDTHPCWADRVRNMQNVGGLLNDPLHEPASVLFPSFSDLCRRATRHQYERTLGDQLGSAQFVTVEELLADAMAIERRRDAINACFGPQTEVYRWFQFPSGPPPEGEIRATIAPDDVTEPYWTWLKTSLNRFGASKFIRAGGKVQLASFDLTLHDLAGAEAEAQAARDSLDKEIEGLRERFRSNGYLLLNASPAAVEAYRAFSAEQDNVTELWHQWFALDMQNEHLTVLPNTTQRDWHSRRVTAICEGILNRVGSALAERLLNGIERRSVPAMASDELASAIMKEYDALGRELLGQLCVEAFPSNPAPVDPKTA